MGASSSSSSSLPEAGTDLTVPVVGGSGDVDTSSLDEILLGDFSETFIYKIPPRASAEGYCADSWGLDSPALTGRLRVTAWSTTICIVIWRRAADTVSTSSSSSSTSAILRRAPLTASPVLSGWLVVANARWDVMDSKSTLSFWLEPVLDSSRYFVLRCMPPPPMKSTSAASDSSTGTTTTRASQHVMLGIGFRERESAFSLKAAISDHARSCERQAGIVSQIAVTDNTNNDVIIASQKSVQIQQQHQRHQHVAAPSDQIRLLRPPPPPPPQTLASLAITNTANTADDDDIDFGDFNTA